MQPVGQPVVHAGVQLQTPPPIVGRGPSFATTTRQPDVVDVQLLPTGLAPAACQPPVAEPVVDPTVASFQALQLWARSGSCTSVTDSGIHFLDRQPTLFAPGCLPVGI